MQLSLKKVEKIVERELKDGKRFTRYIDVNFYSKKSGWSNIVDKNRITVVTSKLYNTSPYEREKKQKTIPTNSKDNVKKLKDWLETIY